MNVRSRLQILISSLIVIDSTLSLADENNTSAADKWRAESIVEARIVEGMARSGARVYATAVGAPLGYMLLMRKDGDICAVRFTEFHRGNDSKPQTRFRTNEETLYAEYDWYSFGEKNRNQSKRNLISGHESLIYKPIVGYGHLRIQRGKVTVKCGALEATWAYPVSVSLLKPNGTYESNGIEVAPTQWAHVGDVDLSSPGLVWYQYSEARALTYIPLRDLPGRPPDK